MHACVASFESVQHLYLSTLYTKLSHELRKYPLILSNVRFKSQCKYISARTLLGNSQKH